MANILGLSPIILCTGGFLLGWITSVLVSSIFKRPAGTDTRDEHHQIRSLEASLRIAQKKAEEATAQLEQATVAMDEMQEQLETAENLLYKREVELCDSKSAVGDETAKVRALRVELSCRAEDTIRAECAAREFETELSVMQAGATVMSDEVDRLSTEHATLTQRLDVYETGTFRAQNPEANDSDADLPLSDKDLLPDY